MAGRIRIGVAIVAGGAFGALVVLWGGLGPDGRGETRSADAFQQCELQEGCVPSPGLTPLPTPAPSVRVTRPRPPSSTPRGGRPRPSEPAAAVAGAENPAATPTPAPASPTSTKTPVEPTPSASGGDPFGVIVDMPPIILPTCILDC